MNTAIAKIEGARARVLRVEWGYCTPKTVEIRYDDERGGDVKFLDTGYPWESCAGILHEDMVEVT